jgi:cytochrome oxidase Cu insertion factor (SCO1/SenC/PrrC family)
MRTATDRITRLPRVASLLAGLMMASHLVVPLARADEAAPAGDKPCCHKTAATAEAPLPAGMTDLAGDGAVPARTPGSAGATVALVEAALLDQDGRPVRFPAEVIGDRIVVMDFVFTTCTTICPILSAKLTRLQERLGDRAGREVQLLSFSIDPARDTPARLKAFGARFKAGPGWTWLTGGVADVERVLRGLGAYTPSVSEHPPMMLVGDGRTGRFTRLNGFPDPDKLLAAVDELVRARGAVAGAGSGE